ncbi:MAG: NACHT domain-containing protein [Xanthobacteraceae bacterium]
MAIRIGDASWKPNWPGFATEIAEIVVQALVLGPNGFSNAVSALMRAFRGVRGNDSTEHVATQLVLGTLGYSISGILTTSRLGRKPDKAEAKALIEDVINRAELIADQQKILLDSNHLENPASFSLFQDAEKRIYHSLKPFQPKDSEYNIKALFRRFASEGMHRIRIRDPEYYYPVIEALSGPDTRADARVRAWAQYRSLLIKRFEEEPLFGEDPVSGVTLGQIYQPLRGWWDEDEEELAPNSDQAKGEKEQPFNIHRHIGMLDRLIQSWLDASDPTDRIRLISGGPGSGKSTYAKWLAAKLATELSWRVVFVPLQRLKGAGPLETRIDEYFRLQLDEPFNADTAPLSTLGRDGHSDWVIIFDGLDELAKEGPSSESAAQDFASALADWRGRVGSIPVRFIVLGRAPSMQEARKRLGLHGQGTLYVADMTPFPKEETSNNRKIVIHDPDKIKELDQRLEFWVKWAAAKGLPPSAPEAMTTEALSDLTKEPLLAYLLIFSGYVGEQWKEAAENRNRIYEEIFKQIWQRERTKDARAHLNELGSEGFNALMQCLGLAAWRGGGRTGDETTFIAVRDTFMQPALLDKATNCGAADLSNVAILFYTRKDEEGGKGYEFLHKSFGEYLTAKGLLSAFQRWGGKRPIPSPISM